MADPLNKTDTEKIPISGKVSIGDVLDLLCTKWSRGREKGGRFSGKDTGEESNFKGLQSRIFNQLRGAISGQRFNFDKDPSLVGKIFRTEHKNPWWSWMDFRYRGLQKALYASLRAGIPTRLEIGKTFTVSDIFRDSLKYNPWYSLMSWNYRSLQKRLYASIEKGLPKKLMVGKTFGIRDIFQSDGHSNPWWSLMDWRYRTLQKQLYIRIIRGLPSKFELGVNYSVKDIFQSGGHSNPWWSLMDFRYRGLQKDLIRKIRKGLPENLTFGKDYTFEQIFGVNAPSSFWLRLKYRKLQHMLLNKIIKDTQGGKKDTQGGEKVSELNATVNVGKFLGMTEADVLRGTPEGFTDEMKGKGKGGGLFGMLKNLLPMIGSLLTSPAILGAIAAAVLLAIGSKKDKEAAAKATSGYAEAFKETFGEELSQEDIKRSNIGKSGFLVGGVTRTAYAGGNYFESVGAGFAGLFGKDLTTGEANENMKRGTKIIDEIVDYATKNNLSSASFTDAKGNSIQLSKSALMGVFKNYAMRGELNVGLAWLDAVKKSTKSFVASRFISLSDRALPKQSKLTGFQFGGISYKESMARVSEGNMPELHVPLKGDMLFKGMTSEKISSAVSSALAGGGMTNLTGRFDNLDTAIRDLTSAMKNQKPQSEVMSSYTMARVEQHIRGKDILFGGGSL